MFETAIFLAQLSITPQAPLTAKQESKQIKMTLAQCTQTEPSNKYSYRVASTSISPAFAIRHYISQQSDYKNNDYNVSSAKVTILEKPKYGRLSFRGSDFEFSDTYGYISDPSYLGKDKVVSLVELNGEAYKIITTIYVANGFDESLCTNVERIPPKLMR